MIARFGDIDGAYGMHPVGLGGYWGLVPGELGPVAPSVTVTTTGTIDWSTASIFQYQLTTADAWAPSFANAKVGQKIEILITQPASGTDSTLATTNMGTITWVGATYTLSTTNSYVDWATIFCIAPGVYIGHMRLHVG